MPLCWCPVRMFLGIDSIAVDRALLLAKRALSVMYECLHACACLAVAGFLVFGGEGEE